VKRIKNLQIGLIVLAFCVTIGVLFGGQALTAKLKVEDPLQRDLHQMKAIRDFKVKEEKDGLIVTIKLQKVDDLQYVLDYVQQKINNYYNQPIKNIKIVDHRNHDLESLRYQLSFNLEEAIVSGHYIQLKSALDGCKGVKAKAYFSQKNMYLQLEKGRDYLYEVLPIHLQLEKNNILGGGDAS
jgi:hypothetical protein